MYRDDGLTGRGGPSVDEGIIMWLGPIYASNGIEIDVTLGHNANSSKKNRP